MQVLNVHLFADASPQRHGAELFASTFELFDGETFIRKLLPVVSLPKNQLDAIGKCLASGLRGRGLSARCHQTRSLSFLNRHIKSGEWLVVCNSLYVWDVGGFMVSRFVVLFGFLVVWFLGLLVLGFLVS